MIQPIKKKKKKKKYGKLKGLPPGSLVHIGNNIVENVEIELIEYNQTLHTEAQLNTIEEASACLENKHVSWININGISDTKLVGEVGKIFNLHPLKEMVSGLIKSPSTLIHDHTKDYFRDVQDHLIQLVDNLETYREWNAELKDIYLSSLSNKMNQIMKVLTIISTIFIPLTFIAGIYGMNFQYMPELSYPYAYPMVWGFMLIIFLVMIYYFRRKKWF